MARTLLIGLAATTLSASALAAGLGSFPPSATPYGSIAPPTVTGDFIDGNQQLYRVWFDNISAAGDLLRHSLGSDGKVVPSAAWSAAAKLDARDFASRKVFRGNAPATNLCASGLPLDSFLCGDASNEAANGGSYRDRSSKLGSLIHSNPVYVGAPTARHHYNDYLAFVGSVKNRPGRLYVGGNDGMLHAFDNEGNEIFGFIPTPVASGSALADWAGDPAAGHAYFVDGPQTVADAYHASFAGSSQWRSILVGGLGAGGKGYYGFDVTNPMSAASSLAEIAATRLWELDPSTLPGLGYTYGQALITRSNAGDNWVLIAPNGYAAGGEPILYIRDINNPSVVLKDFDNLAAPLTAPQGNGLSSPKAIDLDGDQRVDYVYAGDLDGNLWRFDLTAANPTNWQATKLFRATDAGGNPQPILAAPEVAKLSDNSVMVYFGSGDFAGVGSASGHSFYALKDVPSAALATPYQRNALQLRVLAATASDDYRSVDSNHANNYNPINGNPVLYNWPSQRGWYLDLASGEQLLQHPILSASRVQFVTHNPANGNNWLTQLEYAQGLLPSQIVFDTDGDEQLTSADHIDGVQAVSARKLADLISGPTLAALDGGRAISYLNLWNHGSAAIEGSAGTTVTTYEEASCSRINFNRLRLNRDGYVTYTVTATLSNGNSVTASIDFDPSSERTKNPKPSTSEYPAYAGAGEGELTSDGSVQKWFGLQLSGSRTGSDDLNLRVHWHSPYKITSLVLSSSRSIEEIKEGVSTCQNYGVDYNNKQCTGSGSSCQSGQMSLSGSTITSRSGWNGLNASSLDNPTTVTEVGGTEGTPAEAATGAGGDQLQSGDTSTTGRIRWRELTF